MIIIVLIKIGGAGYKDGGGQLASDTTREHIHRKQKIRVCDHPTQNTSGKSRRFNGRI